MVNSTALSSKNVFFLSPSEGATVYFPFLFKRLNANQKINEAELYNLTSQAIWQLFDKERSQISRRLDVSELDIILADARVLSVLLDGSKVINPLDFSARTIEIYLAVTLMKRPVENIPPFFSLKKETSLVFEPNAALARQLKEESKEQKFILAAADKEKTHFYLAEPAGKIIYLDSFDWGENRLIGGIMENFGVPEESAKEMLNYYLSRQTSFYYFQKFKAHFSRLMAELLYGITAILYNNKMAKEPVYVSGQLIGSVDKNHWQFKAGQPRLRFIFSGDKEALVKQELKSLADHKDLNQFTRQRIKWLIPSVNK